MAAPEHHLENGGYVRHPTICKGRIAFVVEEDIWLTECCAKGTQGPKHPRRMTNFGRAAHPLFSPSADYIAFTDSSDLWVLTVKDGRCRFTAQCSLTHGVVQCDMPPKLQAPDMVCHGRFRLQLVCRCSESFRVAQATCGRLHGKRSRRLPSQALASWRYLASQGRLAATRVTWLDVRTGFQGEDPFDRSILYTVSTDGTGLSTRQKEHTRGASA